MSTDTTDKKIAKKIAFVTGANRGLGFETVRELAEKGVRVVLGSRDQAKGEKAIRDLNARGLEATLLVVDVTQPADHQKAFDFIQKNFGKLDILVNNAGVYLDNPDASNRKPNSTSEVSAAVLHQTFEANFFSVVALTQTLLPLILKSPAGRIVNLSSILGSLTLHSDPSSRIYDSKAFAYNASKSALNAFTVHLAHELKETPVKVNSAHPGWVKTDMGGPNAMIELKDGGKTSVELALLPANGPTGGFFHLGEAIAW